MSGNFTYDYPSSTDQHSSADASVTSNYSSHEIQQNIFRRYSIELVTIIIVQL